MAQGVQTIRRKAQRKPFTSRAAEDSRSAVSETFSPEDLLSAKWLTCGAALGATFLWAYWPTLVEMVHAWNTQADYSHGYFVVPLALFFLWARRDQFPAEGLSPAILSGLTLVAVGAVLRILGGRYFFGAFDGWSILPWVGGVCLLIGGWKFFKWALPSVLFLFFMIPLPFSAETALSLPLQGIATKLSCWSLHVLGQPALQNGNVILLGKYPLEVAQACSGLRIFVGIAALAFAYVIVVRRPLWEQGLLILSVIPIALAANVTRIVATGLLYQYSTSEAAHQFSHDIAGWVMIPWAAAMFGAVLWYMDQLFKEVYVANIGEVIRRNKA